MNHVPTDAPALDLSRLVNIKRRGDKIEAACPACRETGRDRTGNHLVILPDGRFGCAAFPNDHEHRQRIWQHAGSEAQGPRGYGYLPPVPLPIPPEPLQRFEWPELELGTNDDLKHLSELRVLTGHASDAMNDRYTKFKIGTLRDAVAKLS